MGQWTWKCYTHTNMVFRIICCAFRSQTKEHATKAIICLQLDWKAGEKREKNQSIIILRPFVLLEENILSYVEWNHVDTHKCVSLCQEEKVVNNAEGRRDRGKTVWLPLTSLPFFMAYFWHYFSRGRRNNFTVPPSLLSLTLWDRRFIVLQSAVFCRLPSLLIKAVFFFFLTRQLGQVTSLSTLLYKYRQVLK